MEQACGPDFADAYLSGAVEDRDGLMPHTFTAWQRLTNNGIASRVLKDLGITLLKPQERNRAQHAISDEAYDRLSLSDKIRQHRWLADQAFMKAGPMWKAGKHLNADQMPQSWHDLIDKAKGHIREAKRLNDFLHPA